MPMTYDPGVEREHRLRMPSGSRRGVSLGGPWSPGSWAGRCGPRGGSWRG